MGMFFRDIYSWGTNNYGHGVLEKNFYLTIFHIRFENTLFCCSVFHPVLTEFIMSNKPAHEAHSLSGQGWSRAWFDLRSEWQWPALLLTSQRHITRGHCELLLSRDSGSTYMSSPLCQ